MVVHHRAHPFLEMLAIAIIWRKSNSGEEGRDVFRNARVAIAIFAAWNEQARRPIPFGK